MSSIVLPVILDESELRASLQKVAGELSNVSKKLKSDVDNFSKAFEEQGKKESSSLVANSQKAVDNTGKLNDKLINTAALINVGKAAYSGLVELGTRFFSVLSTGTRDAQAQFDAIRQIQLFSGNINDVDVIRGKLDDVKNQLEAMSLVSFLSRGGFNSEEVERFAQAINLVAARTGTAKSAVEQMLKSGQLSADALASLGKSQEEVTALIAKAEAAAGVPLTALERTQVLLRAWGDEIFKAESSLGKFGQSNPFDVLKRDIESAWQEARKGLLPFIEDLSKEFKKLTPTIQETTKKILDGFKEITLFVRDYVAPIIQKVIDGVRVLGGALAGVAALVTGQWRTANAIFEDTAKNLNKVLGITNQIKEASKKKDDDYYGIKASTALLEESHKRAMKLRAERLTAEAQEEKRRQGLIARRRAQFEAEAAQERKSAQATFRGLQRNIVNTKLQAVASTGAITSGLVSQIANSMKQIRVLELAGATSTKTGKELIALYQGQAGDAINRFAIKQERAVEALKGQNSLFEEGKQLAALRSQQLLEETSINDSLNQVLSARNLLMKSGFGRYASEIKQLDDLWQRLKGIKAARQGVAKEAQRLLEIQVAFNKAMENVGFKKEELQLKSRLEILALENKSLLNNNALDSVERIRIQNAQRMKEISLEQETLEIRRNALLEKRKNASIEDQSRLDKEISSLSTRIALMKEEGLAISQNTILQEKQFSVLGSFLEKMKTQAKDVGRILGESLSGNVMSFTNSVGNAFASLFSDLVKGEKDAGANFGKSLLSALGDMAIAFASTFAGIGAGKIAMGDFVGGSGLLAASVALFAAAGLVKGFASGSSSSSSSPSSSSPTRQQLPNVQPQREQERNTYILVSNRIFGSEEDQARSLKNFVQKNQRVTGKIL